MPSFPTGVKFDHNDSTIDFGPVRLNGDFSFSFWVKPDEGSIDGKRMTLLSESWYFKYEPLHYL